MFRSLLTTALLFTSPAIAGKNDAEWNPPARYDHAPTIPVTYTPMKQAELYKVCKSLGFAGRFMKQRGCSVMRGGKGTVYYAKGGFGGASEAAIIRHENGHINGWPANHPQ